MKTENKEQTLTQRLLEFQKQVNVIKKVRILFGHNGVRLNCQTI